MKIALCNEVLQPLPFAQQCHLAAALGYDALEVAPFTLAEDPMALTDAQARELRGIAEDHGLAISGLHWLLVAPAGLSIVSADGALRERTTGVMERRPCARARTAFAVSRDRHPYKGGPPPHYG